MAIVRVDVTTQWAVEERRRVLANLNAAVVAALVVPPDDPTIHIIESPAESVSIPGHASARYSLITVTLFEGRSLDTKRNLCQGLTDALAAAGVPPEDVDVVLVEQPIQNWARAGVLASERDLGFNVEV